MPSTRTGSDVWDYSEAVAWLYGRQSLGIRLGLDKMHRLLDALDRPQDSFHAVHVAGTNGKGSVSRLIAEALRRSGHRTGLTTSPHLVRFTERILVDGEPVAEEAVAAGLARVRHAVAALDAEGEPPTFFEAVTALAFLLFKGAGVEWAVVETGMGGRLDATNVLRPRLTVITNVDLDHAEHLGGHVAEVAYEKAGIMKPGVPCVTGATGDALVVLKGVSHEVRAPMSILGEDYHVVPDWNGLRLVRPGGEGHYDVGLAGEHQLHNAGLAVAAVDALRTQGALVSEVALQQALASTSCPGRLESMTLTAGALDPDGTHLDRQVEVLLDAAHNVAAAHAVRRHLGRIDWTGFHLIAGFCSDKDWRGMLEQWVPLASHVWGVPIRNPRALGPGEMEDAVAAFGIPFTPLPDARAALGAATAAGATQILVAGSIFLVGEARAHLTGEDLEEIRGSQ